MKLRIKGNSVRLRLQRAEIEALHDEGIVEETLVLGVDAASNLRYVLRALPQESPRIEMSQGELNVAVPSAWARELADTNRVGFDASIDTAPGVTVRLLLEKDFQCLVERPEEDDSDAFPNPEAGACSPPRNCT